MSDERNIDLDIVKRHCADLGEHFDSVQIFATRLKDEGDKGTVHVQYGSGNWFARYGHIRHWLITEDEDARISVRKEKEED